MMTSNEWVRRMEVIADYPNSKYQNKYPKNLLYWDGTRWWGDCVNIQKALFNGRDVDSPGVNTYQSDLSKTGDCTEWELLKQCTDISQNFGKLKAGEPRILYMDGHIGAYLGKEKKIGKGIVNAVECTPAWEDGIQYSYVDGNGGRHSYKGAGTEGYWTHHGKATKWVTYSAEPAPTPKDAGGVDICYHSGNVDWKTAKANGINFVILRDGWGMEDTDPKLAEYAKQAQAAGLTVPGVYHFIYGINEEEARKNAAQAIQGVKTAGLPKTTVIWCDLEYDTVDNARDYRGVTLTAEMQRKMTAAFCDEILKAGYPTGFYATQDYIRNVYGEKFSEKYDLWLADYEGEPGYKCVYRQTSGTAKVPGFNGITDTDVYVGQYTAGTAKPGGSGGLTPSPKDQNVTYQLMRLGQCAIKDVVISKGSELTSFVTFIQEYLAYYGWYSGDIDGDFGSMTEASVKGWQAANGLYVDGVIGPACLEFMSKY